MNIHVGASEAVKAFLAVIIVGFFWRLLAAHNADNSLGQAMSFVY